MESKHSTLLETTIATMGSLGLFLGGIGFFIISLAIPLIKHEWELSQTTLGLLGSAAPIGAIFGAFIAGYCSDKYGRKKILSLSIFAILICSILSAFAQSITNLIIARIALGVSISMCYPVTASYLAEMMPKKNRGKQITKAMFTNCLGAVVGIASSYLIIHVDPEYNAWRFMLLLPALPATLALLISFKIPESPRWLISKGRIEEAECILSGLSISREKLLAHKNDPFPISDHQYKDLFSRRFIRNTLLACLPWFLMDISFYGVGIFTPLIMQSLHFAYSASPFDYMNIIAKQTVIVNIFFLLGAFIAISLIDKVGRIALQTWGFLAVTVGLLVLTLATVIPQPHLRMIMMFLGFFIFNFFINLGPNMTTYLIPAEIYPTALRASGHGFATSCGKIGAALGIFFLPILQDKLGTTITILLVAISSFLGFLITLKLGIETKDKTLEEIQQHHQSS
jgi:MFS family permease